MGVQISQEVAEEIFTACQRPNAQGRIDDILHNENFRTLLSNLLEEVPFWLKKQVHDKMHRKKQEYGEEKVISHRAFSSLWASPGPSFDSSLGKELLKWYEKPATLFNVSSSSPDSSPGSYIASLYLLAQRRMADKIRWRLSLIPLATLSKKFKGIGTESLNKQVTDILIASKCVSDDKEEISQRLPSLFSAAKKYQALCDKIGIGSLCCLPPDIGDNIWENRLPYSGEVHEACVKLLLDTDIREVSSTIIGLSDHGPVTVSLAATKVVDFWEKKLNEFNLEYTQPEGFPMTVTTVPP
ncbi:uncharacterized protein BDV17DRAFT_116643 [Aspergillus undulatus]|uniref:uncharacterized protein n=1 Tax=Aspergillus undulatus TaxID=1810928 RepID=UPI003CCDE14E